MKYDYLITNLFKGIKKQEIVRSTIPMGYVPGIPMLSIQNDNLVLIVPFLRYKETGTIDHTLVFPVKYVLEYSLPECQLIRFRDLSFEKGFNSVNFQKAVGFFRHEAVRMLDKTAYGVFKTETLSLLDELADSLLSDSSDYTAKKDLELKHHLNTILEPSLKGFYKTIEPDFYARYFDI